MEVVSKEDSNSFSFILQVASGNLKTEFYTIALQPALGSLHNACKLKLPLVTGIWHRHHRILYVQRALLQLQRCQSPEKSMIIQQLLCLHFDKMF